MDLLASPTLAPLARITLLTGCAGSGKTYAINKLRESAGQYCAITASTLNAAGIHADSCTVHKYLGFNTSELLDLNSTDSEWFAAYKEKHKDAFSYLARAHRDYIANPDHHCQTLRMRCAKCREWMNCPKTNSSSFSIENGFAGPASIPMLVIDEYGMLTGGMLNRILIALKLWAPPGDQHLIVLVGSVTQLQPGRGPEDRNRPDDGLWTFAKWDRLLVSTFNLPFSVRSIEDPEYSECCDMMQFNVSTRRTQEIMQSRVSPCTHLDRMTPRVYHQDAMVKNTNSESLQRTQGLERVFKPRIFYGNMKDATERKRFHAMCRSRFKHIDFFEGVKVRVGSLVCVLKYQPQQFEGCLGVIEELSPSVKVRSLESQNVHTIGTCNIMFEKMRSVELLPLKLAHGMNTYFCQGLTFKFPIVYSPPAQYALSPIKPSCYVVCTRVTNRRLLNLTNCSFANSRTGETCYFSPECVRFKLECELGYRIRRQ
uniref:DNA helicase n=3 Tax=Cyprinid herpesvirus 1 TaxID=317858 RepID=Q52UP4_9VIRU|nr:DNA helicase [Cyprinid herpesvirus 1]